jgi:hypothetical protein
MSKRKQMQRLIRAWKDETEAHEIDMREVAKWAHKKGWPLPTPPDPMDMLTKQFTEAAREDIGYDKKTGKPFRVYHAIKAKHGATQLHLFIDIEEATRPQMLGSLVMRREQMVSDGVMLTYPLERSAFRRRADPASLGLDLRCRLAPRCAGRR